MLIVRLDTSKDTLTYVNAGHDSPFLVRRGSEAVQLEATGGPPLGTVDKLDRFSLRGARGNLAAIEGSPGPLERDLVLTFDLRRPPLLTHLTTPLLSDVSIAVTTASLCSD